MQDSLQAGLQYVLRFRVPPSKVVPALYPESPAFQAMPEVFATGYLVGLVEWACVEAINPHLDPSEITVGTHVNISHEAATPPGMEVTVRVELVQRDGRMLRFAIEAHDERDVISQGSHERVVVDRARFSEKARKKQSTSG